MSPIAKVSGEASAAGISSDADAVSCGKHHRHVSPARASCARENADSRGVYGCGRIGKSHGTDSIRPRSRHILVRKLGSGVLPAGALNGGTIMTFLKTREAADIDTSAETEVEGEIREFVRRDVVGIRRQPESDSDLVANNINQLLQRVAGTSVQEIDKLISELQTLRDTLQSEAARVQREIVEYATLSQAALQSTKIIAESLTHWKKVPDAPSLRD